MVIGILLVVMLLNLLGMLLARYIIAHVGMASFQVLGWIFAVLQTSLAVDAVVTSLRNLAQFAGNYPQWQPIWLERLPFRDNNNTAHFTK